MRTLGMPANGFRQAFEVDGEPLHDDGQFNHDKVVCGRLAGRAAFSPELRIELIEEG